MKKSLKVFLSIFSLTLVFLAVSFVINSAKANGEPPPDTGTCCKQVDADCVVGDNVIYDKYYLSEGACP